MSHKKSKLGLGLALGAVAGAIAGLFLAPKPGKELRQDAKKLSASAMKRFEKIKKEISDKDPEEAMKIVFGHVTKESATAYKFAQKELAIHLALLGDNYKKIDKKKYKEIVSQVVSNVKESHKLPEEQLKNLASYLGKDFKKLAAKKKAPAKKTTKKKTNGKKA